MEIVTRVLKGERHKDIAQAMGISRQTIYATLKRPEIKRVLDRPLKELHIEIDILLFPAREALYDALNDKSMNIRLRAVDLIFKINGMYDRKPRENPHRAEAVASRIIAMQEKFQADLMEIKERARGIGELDVHGL